MFNWYTDQLWYSLERNYRGCEWQEVGIIGGHFRGWYHNTIIHAVKNAAKVIKCCDKEWYRGEA